MSAGFTVITISLTVAATDGLIFCVAAGTVSGFLGTLNARIFFVTTNQ